MSWRLYSCSSSLLQKSGTAVALTTGMRKVVDLLVNKKNNTQAVVVQKKKRKRKDTSSGSSGGSSGGSGSIKRVNLISSYFGKRST